MNTKKIKIIHIIPALNIGGAEKILIDILRNINKNRFEFLVICLKEAGVLASQLQSVGIPIVSVDKKSKLGIDSLIKMIRIIRKFQPNIIHTHLFGGTIYGRVSAWIARVKCVVTTEHNITAHEGFAHKIIKKATAGLTNYTTCVSKAVKEYVVAYEGVREPRVQIIYNGIVVEKFWHNQRNYSQKENLIIGSVGRLVWQKGFDILIKAMANLKDRNIECYIAGDGELRDVLESNIKQLNLQNKTRLVGSISNIPDFLKKIDIFILPSRWEGLGIAILEAGLSGLPVIASNVDGIKEIINNRNGLLFKVGDVDDLTDKINKLVNNKTKRKKLGARLQQEVKEKFDLKKIVKQYEDFYLRVAS